MLVMRLFVMARSKKKSFAHDGSWMNEFFSVRRNLFKGLAISKSNVPADVRKLLDKILTASPSYKDRWISGDSGSTYSETH